MSQRSGSPYLKFVFYEYEAEASPKLNNWDIVICRKSFFTIGLSVVFYLMSKGEIGYQNSSL